MCYCSIMLLSIFCTFIAKERAIQTGRIVPLELLEESLESVPQSVHELSAYVEYHVELRNISGAADIELVTPHQTWQSFTEQWIQYVFKFCVMLLL
jgi:hypothetical protein